MNINNEKWQIQTLLEPIDKLGLYGLYNSRDHEPVCKGIYEMQERSLLSQYNNDNEITANSRKNDKKNNQHQIQPIAVAFPSLRNCTNH